MSAKRRAANAALPELATPNNKRRRTTDGTVQETPEGTTETGLRLIQLLKRCRDSTGREVATEFLELPDRKLFPEYYEAIKMPLALFTIEEKLNDHEYPTLEALEGDVKRLIQNARDFNERGSQIADDAERLRKAMANFMPKHNPRYADPSYKAVPTPIPAHLLNDNPPPQSRAEDTKKQTLKLKLTNKRASTGSPAVRTPATKQDPKSKGKPRPSIKVPNLEGMDFQKVQEQIMEEMIHLQDEDGTDLALNFLERPDKKRYADYYRKIAKPVSLYILQKRTKGVVHNKATGVSIYQSWDQFAEDVRLTWKNARAYNEEGSEIYELAGKLEDYFEARLADARSKVKDPPALNAESGGPRLKLKMNTLSQTPEPAQKKLILTHNAPTQGSTGTPHGSGATDIEVQRRQQDVIRVESHSEPKPEQRSTSTQPAAAMAPKVNGTSPAVKPNGMADGTTSRPSTATGSIMLPPGSIPAAAGAASGSPHPQATTATAPASAPVPAPPRPMQHKPTSILDTRLRSKAKDITTALLSNVSIDTHPGIKVEHRFHYDVPASAIYTQQSVTITLPQNQYYLRIGARLSQNAKERVSKKVCLTQNGSLRSAVNVDPDAPVYDFRLSPGINIICVDIIAGPSRANVKPSNIGEAVDFERTTIYAHLLKN